MSNKYRLEVDGLRAVAVLPVVFFHAGISFFSGGYVGVDVFFVISGYLITSIILSEIAKGSFSFKSFYEKRIRRIAPALFFVIAVSLPVAYLLMTPSELKSFSQSLISVILLGSNIFFWRESDYFGPAAEYFPLLHTWSLSVEEQFYVFFPLLILFVMRWGRRVGITLVSTLIVFSFFIAEWASIKHPVPGYFLLPTRSWELAVGALAALILHDKDHFPCNKWLGELLSFFGLGLILASGIFYTKDTPFPGMYALLPTMGTLLIILFATQETCTGRFLGIKPLVTVGLISYSLYLWHQPIFAFARIV